MRLPIELEEKMKKEEEETEVYTLNHLPIVTDYAKRLQFTETINYLVASDMEVDPGTVLLGLVLDTLSGRTPLYRLDEFFENQDRELLLGENIGSDKFADYNVGRVLDKIYEVGTMKIFSAISGNAVSLWNIPCNHVSFDTTSVNVYGDYDLYPNEDHTLPFLITFGKSKDHRPDLKQFLISMLCVDRNVPIFGKTEDGNGSDKNINNRILSEISKRMADHGLKDGSYIYIADSAVVTEKNLKSIGDDILFITRLPATYNECHRVIKEAVEKDEWDEAGPLAFTKPTVNRPSAYYKTYESEVELYGRTYRAVVIRSSAHDKRRQKRADREITSEYKTVKTKVQQEEKKCFYCKADAESASLELMKSEGKYHRFNITVEERPVYKVGRPKGGIREIKEMRYGLSVRIEKNDQTVSELYKEAGCFVLLTNVPKAGKDGYDAKTVLKTYKDQHGIEQNFGFLKDPAIVNGIFLKRPERIEVLGLILLLALLIWRLIERDMRQYVEQTGETLPGWKNRRTERPTSFMLVTKFSGIAIIKCGNVRKLNKPLTSQQKEYLKALNIKPEIFINPGAG